MTEKKIEDTSIEEMAKRDGYDDPIKWMLSLYDKRRPRMVIYEGASFDLENSEQYQRLVGIVKDYYEEQARDSKDMLLVAKSHELLHDFGWFYGLLYGRRFLTPYIPERGRKIQESVDKIFDFYKENTEGDWKSYRERRSWKRDGMSGDGWEQAIKHLGEHKADGCEIKSIIDVPLASDYNLFSRKKSYIPTTVRAGVLFKNKNNELVDKFEDFFGKKYMFTTKAWQPEKMRKVVSINFPFLSFKGFDAGNAYKEADQEEFLDDE